ncbi:MAG: prepilin-type N-terminal cleavage/methylation domain-containing protein [Sphingopyxis sp.]|nr:prepilin-type N-terminal cleavage/methylation domain-containing protein [Sphingopyxis sp.]
MKHCKCNPAASAGFTLLEMLVVFAIIAFAGLAAFSFWGVRQGQSALQLARLVASIAAEAAVSSVAKRQTETLIFLNSERRISSSASKVTVTIPQPITFFVTAAEEIRLKDGSMQIQFYPNGTSSGGEIIFSDQNGNVQTVQIHWLTGAITTFSSNRSSR